MPSTRKVATCSRGKCKRIAEHFCAPCKRAFCSECWVRHQDSVHADDELESEILSEILAQLARLNQGSARRVLKDAARQVGLKFMPGAGWSK